MAKLEEEQLYYLKDPIFYQRYIKNLNNRLIYSNNRLELSHKEMDDLYDYANVSTLDDNYEAFNLLLEKLNSKEERPLIQELIIKVANTINRNAMYISNGYRKGGDDVAFDEKYPIEQHKNIEEKMQELLDKYYGEWSKLDVFEREARFNIEFLRIHPFEDGNGRTSRLLLNFNLLRQGYAPVLIPVDKREEYFAARNREDVDSIRKLFKESSEHELSALNDLIEKYKKENEKPRTR